MLAEAVNAAFALFKAVGIPGKIVVQNGGEDFLKVDAFAEAIGGDEDAGLGLIPGHLRNAVPTNVVGIFAGDDLEIELRILLAEGRAEMGTEVYGGFDVAAEDDGIEAFFEPLFEDDGGGEELAILLDIAELFEPLGEGFQLTALVFGPVALFEDLSRGVVAFEAVVEVADGVFGFGGFADCCVGIRRSASARRSSRVLSILTPASGLDMTPRRRARAVQY